MIYKLLNKLFGWDYIVWSDRGDYGVSRVHVDGMYRVWYWRFRPTSWAEFIVDPTKVIWLTCSPNKYFPPSLPKITNVDVLTALKRACRFIDSIPYYIDADGTVNIKDLLATSVKEIHAILGVIEQLEGTEQ